MNICKTINCPFFNSATNSYGCQRYMVSNHCHLITKFPNIELNPNQYVLTNNENLNLEEIKQANIDFFKADKAYLEKVEHQQTHSDWYLDTDFKVSSLN